MSDIDIAAIRALAEKATPGPWEADGSEVLAEDGELCVADTFGDYVGADFIAVSRTLVPALCDEVERLRGESFALQRALSSAAGANIAAFHKLRATQRRAALWKRAAKAYRVEAKGSARESEIYCNKLENSCALFQSINSQNRAEIDRLRADLAATQERLAAAERVVMAVVRDGNELTCESLVELADALRAYDAIAGRDAAKKEGA